MKNFYILATKIVSLRFKVPANFNDSRVFTAFLHENVVMDASQTIQRST